MLVCVGASRKHVLPRECVIQWFASSLRVRGIFLGWNKFSGAVPDQVSNLQHSLKELQLNNNALSSTIPTWFGAFSLLEYVAVEGNADPVVG